MALNLWSTPVPIFTTSTGVMTGLQWNRGGFGQSNIPVVLNTATPSDSYVAGGFNNYTLYLTAQSWDGDAQPSIAVAQTGDIALPFAFARGVVFSSAGGVVNDGLLWWSASTTVGAYNINFEAYTNDTNATPTTTPALSPSGNVVTLETDIVNPAGWSAATNANHIVLLYGTAASPTTIDLHLQVFNAAGQPLTQSTVVETIPRGTAGGSVVYSARTGSFLFIQTATVGGTPGIEFTPINLATGTLGTPVFQAVPKPAAVGSASYTINNFSLQVLPNGNFLEFVSWRADDASNRQGITTRLLDANFNDITATTPTFRSATIENSGQQASLHWQPVTLPNGATALVYSANGGVYINEFDANGNQTLNSLLVSSDGFPAPTDFDSVIAMGSRFEIIYRANDPETGETIQYGVIYDTASRASTFTINNGANPSGQWVGTPYDDTVTYGAGINYVNGGGGTDVFVATNFTASQVDVVVNGKGNVVFSDGKGDTDTLTRFSRILLSDATITIDGNRLTQDNDDGSSSVSIFNISGQPYASYEQEFDAEGHLLETIYFRTDGSIYDTEVACYCSGTLITTAAGDVPVEDLKIGDRLLTSSGRVRPVKWIGRRSYSSRFAKSQKHLLPICITAGALDEAIPARDLWVSPHHAVFIDGVLIEARDLVNDASIFRADVLEGDITYIHVELEDHDVILANGAWSETFLDDGSRGMFHNAEEFAALYPKGASVRQRYCAPRVEDGVVLDAVQRRLVGRASRLSVLAQRA